MLQLLEWNVTAWHICHKTHGHAYRHIDLINRSSLWLRIMQFNRSSLGNKTMTLCWLCCCCCFFFPVIQLRPFRSIDSFTPIERWVCQPIRSPVWWPKVYCVWRFNNTRTPSNSVLICFFGVSIRWICRCRCWEDYANNNKGCAYERKDWSVRLGQTYTDKIWKHKHDNRKLSMWTGQRPPQFVFVCVCVSFFEYIGPNFSPPNGVCSSGIRCLSAIMSVWNESNAFEGCVGARFPQLV